MTGSKTVTVQLYWIVKMFKNKILRKISEEPSKDD